MVQNTSFLRDAGKHCLQYAVVGVAAMPAGLAYALLAISGYQGWWTVVPSVAFGLFSATVAWGWLQKKLYPRVGTPRVDIEVAILVTESRILIGGQSGTEFYAHGYQSMIPQGSSGFASELTAEPEGHLPLTEVFAATYASSQN
ncbi:MAG TPA: hypothetical protein VK709_12260 [Candidatus Saccharimonadales bacterium]|jgi:hypothetical protein|nr:hypothetical protein [Candidatus Saccharimonadales bacterium]